MTADGAAYVLRIHAPVEGFSLKLLEQGSAKELISGEIALLLHLSETAPFPVQKHVKNRLGEYTTILSDGTPAELLQWIEGKTLQGEAIEQYAGELGALAAQINAVAEGFTGERISYSYGLVRQMRLEFAIAKEKEHLTQEQVLVCNEVLDEIERIMSELDGQPDSKCLIHADLSTENILKTPSGLAAIDFSLSGFGFRAQECGMLAFNYEHEEAKSLSKTIAKTAPL